MTLYQTTFLMTEIFFIYICYLYFDSFLEKIRTNRTILFLTYVVSMIIIDGQYLLLYNWTLNLIANILFMFLITMNYEATYKKRIMIVLLFYAISASAETIVITFLFHVKDYSRFHGIYEEFFLPITIKLVFFIIVLILRNCKSIKRDVMVPVSYWINTFIIPFGSVYLLYCITRKTNYFNNMEISLCVTVILAINIAVFYLYDTITHYYNDKIKTELLKQENIYYSQQFDNIMEHMDEVRAFRHDLRNHLEVLDSLVGSEPDKAREYISGITGVLSAGKQYCNTGNIPIDSIINYKLAKAQEHQAEIKTEIAIPAELQMEPQDMVVILGNLLDNAINAIQKIGQGRKIELQMLYDRGILKIDISNTYNGIVIYEKEKIKTTAGKEGNHGYGLRNVEAALKKYHGLQKVSHDDHIFHVSVLIYTDSTCYNDSVSTFNI